MGEEKPGWLIYVVNHKEKQYYLVARSIGAIMKQLIKIYGPKAKLEDFKMELVNLGKEATVIGR